jgi:hypothetical protein
MISFNKQSSNEENISAKEARFSEGLSGNLSLFDHSRSGYSLLEHIIDRTHR